jgi:hypothetical protein
MPQTRDDQRSEQETIRRRDSALAEYPAQAAQAAQAYRKTEDES